MGESALRKAGNLHISAHKLHHLLACRPAGNACFQLVEGLHGVTSMPNIPPGSCSHIPNRPSIGSLKQCGQIPCQTQSHICHWMMTTPSAS